jgi:hypothetical protein
MSAGRRDVRRATDDAVQRRHLGPDIHEIVQGRLPAPQQEGAGGGRGKGACGAAEQCYADIGFQGIDLTYRRPAAVEKLPRRKT